MTPITFPEQTTIFAKDQPEYQPLPAHVSRLGVVTSCWQLDDAEIAELVDQKTMAAIAHLRTHAAAALTIRRHSRGARLMARMKTLDLKVLIDDGYLQEVNRQWFHPLGLALAVTLPTQPGDDPVPKLSILDARDDAEGLFNFVDGDDLLEKYERLRAIRLARMEARVKGLGYWEQPPEKKT